MSNPHQPEDLAPAIQPEPLTGSEPDFMSMFLQNLLQTTPAVTWQDDRRSGGCINFSDAGGFFDKAFSSSGSGDYSDSVACSNKREDSNYLNKVLEGLETAGNQDHPRCSKRTRSAEVHNLSEKKRRCKINEKLKALQTLIPNSNKTDKASMLDEAIEYLKQLQLQVQMLTVKNGFNLPPNYAPMQFPIDFAGRTLLPSIGRGVEGSNTSREADGLSGRGQEMLMQFGIQNPTLLNHQLPVQAENSNSKPPFLMESLILNHFESLNHSVSAKDQCRGETLSHFPLDISCSGDNSSSEVSS